MRRTQLYLDEEIAKALSAVSRQTGKTISILVRECIREKLGRRDTIDKAALAREIAGVWKARADRGPTAQYVRNLRKGSRLKKLSRA